LPLLAVLAFLLRDLAPQVGTGGLLALNFMHLGATWTRLYGDARREHPLGAFLLPVLLLAFAAVTVAAGRTPLLLLLVFMSNVPHIGLQNFGFIRAAERARGIVTTRLDRWLDQYCQGLVPTGLALWFVTRPGAELFDSRAIGLDRLPPQLLAAVGAVVGLLALVTWLRMGWLAIRGQRVCPERFWLHLGWGPAALACFALLPPELAAIPLAGTHYVQYLVIVRRFHQRGRDGHVGVWGRVPGLAWVLMVALLAPGIPVLVHMLLATRLPGVDVVIGSAASLHHFLVDGRIWKLRESGVARVMLGSRAGASGPTA